MLGCLRVPFAHQQLTQPLFRRLGPMLRAAGSSAGPAGPSSDTGPSPPASPPTVPARVRSYPTEPRVGVGVVILRQLTPHKRDAEVLLIRRGKEPSKGLWCFPGGSLELGETLAACAVRETLEETGVALRHREAAPEEVLSSDLSFPSPIAAADAIHRDAEGRLEFHYALIDMAATPRDPTQHLTPDDDVDDARWVRVDQLGG